MSELRLAERSGPSVAGRSFIEGAASKRVSKWCKGDEGGAESEEGVGTSLTPLQRAHSAALQQPSEARQAA